jgi:surfactin synthase thioesterase subunit/acyl carrier protein
VIVDDTHGMAAYVTFAQGGEIPTLDELRRHMSRRVPAQMVPRQYLVLAGMPLTASGKIDRKALPRQAERLEPAGVFHAPATDTERRLAPLWQSALGVSRISVTDGFFESGGDSLRATALISSLARVFGRELSLSALLQVPTIAQLAALLESDVASPTVYHPHGTRAPFFAISSAPDDAVAFEALARQLGEDWPFIALQSPVEQQVSPVEELAARICRTVRTVRPQGPYVLGGYCFGGLLAFEAARQLRAEGVEVRMVVLFDAARSGYPRFLRTGSSEWRRRLVRARLLPPLRPVGECAVATVAAAGMYAAGPIDVPVAQFKTRQQPFDWRLLGDARLAWRPLCKAGFHVHELEGRHGHPFFERHAAEIASELKRIL